MNRTAASLGVVIVHALMLWVACGSPQQDAVIESPPRAGAGPPRILVTNDDGYSSEGIAALAEALAEFADVLVIAPRANESGASQSHRAYKRETIQLYNVAIGDHLTGYAIEGTPTDCVHLAITGLLSEEPDMVVSGINAGANMGDDVLYSGTVAAAMEGRSLGMSAIAMSLCGKTHFETAGRVAASLVGAAETLTFSIGRPSASCPFHWYQ